MSLLVNTNISSLLAQYNLGVNTQNVQKSFERLSTGYQINRTADNATGYAISENLKGEIIASNQANRNAQDGLGILDIAEGALSQMLDNYQRIRELAVQAGNDSNGPQQREAIALEIQQRLQENDRLTQVTSFNGKILLNGSILDGRIQVGTGSNLPTNTLDLLPSLGNASSLGLGVIGTGKTFANISDILFSSNTTARSFMNDVDTAMAELGSRRSLIGSYQQRLQTAIENLSQSSENFSRANSQIRDVDVASETSKLAQFQILQQSNLQVLAQTNEIPKQILSLLQGRGN